MLLGVGFSVNAQHNLSTAEAEKAKTAILTVLETQRTAWNKGDIEGYMQGYWKSDSLLFVGKSGATYGWQKTLENYKRGYPTKAAMGELTFGIKKVEFLSNTNAFVLGSWLVKTEKAELKGYFTLILRKINGQWLVVTDHSS
jgi:ketosteroid isomerase-like protein